MDVVFPIVLVLAVSIIAVASALLAWNLSNLLLPAWYSMPPIRITLISVGLSVVTSFVVQANLTSGALSVTPLVLTLSLTWSLTLIPTIALFKYCRYAQSGNSQQAAVETNEKRAPQGGAL